MDELGKVDTHTSKESREMECIKSDRVELVEQANRLVETLVMKDMGPVISQNVVGEIAWTNQEKSTYNAALEFLANQFRTGFKESEVVEKSKDVEFITSYHQPPKDSDA